MHDLLHKVLKEPLIQFLAAGALLFALSGPGKGPPEDDGKRIVVTPERVEQLRAAWTKTRQRPPTRSELQGLVDHYVREEVLYREGVAMGLDRDDTIIRRRVAQKLKFLIQDLADAGEPADSELEAYFEKHTERFRRPARITFAHVYFSDDRRGAQAEADAVRLLQRTMASGGPPPDGGDAFLLNSRYEEVPKDRVAGDFGDGFAGAVFAFPEGEWQGPVRSAYGVHLVRVENRIDTALPTFDEVRNEVRTMCLDERRREQNEAIIGKMRDRYEVIVRQGAVAPATRRGKP